MCSSVRAHVCLCLFDVIVKVYFSVQSFVCGVSVCVSPHLSRSLSMNVDQYVNLSPSAPKYLEVSQTRGSHVSTAELQQRYTYPSPTVPQDPFPPPPPPTSPPLCPGSSCLALPPTPLPLHGPKTYIQGSSSGYIHTHIHINTHIRTHPRTHAHTRTHAHINT